MNQDGLLGPNTTDERKRSGEEEVEVEVEGQEEKEAEEEGSEEEEAAEAKVTWQGGGGGDQYMNP